MTPEKLMKILVGPLLFLVTLLIPLFGPIEARIGFGILFWMVYWWVTVAVDIKITCLVPLIVVAFYPFMPREDALKLYMHRDLYLIAGASMLTAAWVRWGLAKRVALNFLSLFGNNARLQTVGWFLLCGFVSFVMGNTPVGAIFTPIAVAALFYAGYKTFRLSADDYVHNYFQRLHAALVHPAHGADPDRGAGAGRAGRHRPEPVQQAE